MTIVWVLVVAAGLACFGYGVSLFRRERPAPKPAGRHRRDPHQLPLIADKKPPPDGSAFRDWR